MKRFISLFMTVIMIFSVVISTDMLSVSATDNSNIKWSFDSKTGTLTISGTGKMDNYNDYDIKTPWYKYSDNISRVTINKGITSIGNFAFGDCENLISIVIPDSVTTIGESAFEWCTSLKSINIPNSVTLIDDSAFDCCENLKNIILPNNLHSISKDTFCSCQSLESITIPNSVTSIYDSAFGGCENLKNITLSNNLKEIYDHVFSDCNSLKYINIPDSVTFIGQSVFEGCNSLSSITIPKSVFYIDNNPFNKCDNLISIEVDKSNNCYTSIDGNLYSKDKTELISYAKGKTNTSFVVPNTVKIIRFLAFEDCSRLKNITLSNNLKEIEGLAFKNCDSLKNIDIPESVTLISNNAFEGCNSLSSIIIPKSVSDIDDNPFYKCDNLISIEVDKNNNCYTSIDGNLYSKDKTELISYAIGKTNTSFTVPNTVTHILWEAFEGSKNLTCIYIPISIKYIAKGAIYGCSNLKDIYYEGTKSQWEKLDINLDENITIHYGKKDNTSSDKPTQKAKFTLGKNSNSYYHSDENLSKSGFKGVKDYSLDKSYYNKLIKGRNNSEIKYLQKNMKNSWSGSCFGIVSTMGLLYNKNIKSQDISSSANKNYYQLPLPYKDKKFLNNIQYYYMIQNIGYSRNRSLAATSSYSMGWVLRGLNYFSNWIKDDSEEDCLKTIVEKVKNTSSKHKTYMFTFSTKEGYGHAVLITDIEYNKDNKEYTLTIFDENTVTPKYPNGMYGTLKIADDYKSFIYDCGGVKFDNENYTNIQLFDLDEVKKAADKPELYAVNDHNRSDSTIRMAINKDMKITNESGKYVRIKDGKIDTNTEINSLYSYTIGNQGMISIDIEGSNFKVSDLDKKCNVSISNNKTFMSLEGNNIKSADLSLNNKKIICSGNGNEKYNFNATCSTDSIVNSATKETGMLEVKGTAKGNTTTTVNNNKLTTTSDSLENAIGSNYIDNTVTKENLTKNKVIKKATVIVRKSINKCKTNKLKTVTYNGKIIKPSVTVKYENRKLVVNKDYKISYSNNKNAGKGKITISGINNYVGTKTLYFSINKAKPTVKFAKPSVTIKKSKKTYVNKLKKKTDGKIVYSSSNKKIAVVNSKGKVTFKRKGKVKIYAQTVKSKNYYNTKTYYVLKIK